MILDVAIDRLYEVYPIYIFNFFGDQLTIILDPGRSPFDPSHPRFTFKAILFQQSVLRQRPSRGPTDHNSQMVFVQAKKWTDKYATATYNNPQNNRHVNSY